MSGSLSTTHYGWPYPAGGDPVTIATYFGDLANAIDASLDAAAHDTGWNDLNVVASNFAVGALQPKWRRCGPNVNVVGNVTRSVATPAGGGWNGAPIFNALPAAARPLQQIVLPQENPGANDATIEAMLDVDGTIQLRNTGSTDLPAGPVMGVFFTFLAG